MGIVAFKRIAESQNPNFALRHRDWFDFFPGEPRTKYLRHLSTNDCHLAINIEHKSTHHLRSQEVALLTDHQPKEQMLLLPLSSDIQ